MREIITHPNEILRKECKPVEEINNWVYRLHGDMLKAMAESEIDAIGIASTQVGEEIKMFIIDTRAVDSETGFVETFINPKIISTSKGTTVVEEGCLSVPGKTIAVERPNIIDVKYKNLQGIKKRIKLEGLNARVFQHEMDHIKGKLIIDREGK